MSMTRPLIHDIDVRTDDVLIALTSAQMNVLSADVSWRQATFRFDHKERLEKAKRTMESALKVMWENNIEGDIIDELKTMIEECDD